MWGLNFRRRIYRFIHAQVITHEVLTALTQIELFSICVQIIVHYVVFVRVQFV